MNGWPTPVGTPIIVLAGAPLLVVVAAVAGLTSGCAATTCERPDVQHALEQFASPDPSVRLAEMQAILDDHGATGLLEVMGAVGQPDEEETHALVTPRRVSEDARELLLDVTVTNRSERPTWTRTDWVDGLSAGLANQHPLYGIVRLGVHPGPAYGGHQLLEARGGGGTGRVTWRLETFFEHHRILMPGESLSTTLALDLPEQGAVPQSLSSWVEADRWHFAGEVLVPGAHDQQRAPVYVDAFPGLMGVVRVRHYLGKKNSRTQAPRHASQLVKVTLTTDTHDETDVQWTLAVRNTSETPVSLARPQRIDTARFRQDPAAGLTRASLPVCIYIESLDADAMYGFALTPDDSGDQRAPLPLPFTAVAEAIGPDIPADWIDEDYLADGAADALTLMPGESWSLKLDRPDWLPPGRYEATAMLGEYRLTEHARLVTEALSAAKPSASKVFTGSVTSAPVEFRVR